MRTLRARRFLGPIAIANESMAGNAVAVCGGEEFYQPEERVAGETLAASTIAD